MITFCFLAAQGGCEPQLTAHSKGNMNLGKDKAFLIKVVSQFPYRWSSPQTKFYPTAGHRKNPGLIKRCIFFTGSSGIILTGYPAQTSGTLPRMCTIFLLPFLIYLHKLSLFCFIRRSLIDSVSQFRHFHIIIHCYIFHNIPSLS